MRAQEEEEIEDEVIDSGKNNDIEVICLFRTFSKDMATFLKKFKWKAPILLKSLMTSKYLIQDPCIQMIWKTMKIPKKILIKNKI